MENIRLVVKIKVIVKFLLCYLKDVFWDLYFSLTLSEKSEDWNIISEKVIRLLSTLDFLA